MNHHCSTVRIVVGMVVKYNLSLILPFFVQAQPHVTNLSGITEVYLYPRYKPVVLIAENVLQRLPR